MNRVAAGWLFVFIFVSSGVGDILAMRCGNQRPSPQRPSRWSINSSANRSS